MNICKEKDAPCIFAQASGYCCSTVCLGRIEKRGLWKIETKGVSYWCCSKCGASAPLDYNGQYELSNYCPNCGEKMENADPSDKVHI